MRVGQEKGGLLIELLVVILIVNLFVLSIFPFMLNLGTQIEQQRKHILINVQEIFLNELAQSDLEAKTLDSMVTALKADEHSFIGKEK